MMGTGSISVISSNWLGRPHGHNGHVNREPVRSFALTYHNNMLPKIVTLFPISVNILPTRMQMSKRGKLVQRFLTMPSDFTWQELVTMLKGFGYEQVIGAKSGGSRVKFLHQALPPISLHKPHPTSILKRYQLEQIEEILKGEDLI